MPGVKILKSPSFFKRDFGNRKYFSVGMSRQMSFGKNKNSQGSAKWVHPPDALLRGHIVYNVKFLGHVEVDQPKGIEVVKDAIRKMKFNKQIKRAEGQKPPKVELTISVDGVTIQEPKYKVIQHQYPLHRISYCADDKSDKRMFTFIAKESDTSVHHCFVFDSEKCAEEITLTIGQAFDHAYKKFMEKSGKDMDTKKQFLLLQKKVQVLTRENLELKARVADLERLIDPKILEDFDRQRNGKPDLEVKFTPPKPKVTHTGHSPPPPPLIPPPASRKGLVSPDRPAEVPSVGRRLEGLVFEEDEKPQTNGTAAGALSPGGVPLLAPPPPVPPRQNIQGGQAPQPALTQPPPASVPVDLFGATPFTPPSAPSGGQQQKSNPFSTPSSSASDPFGMPAFNPLTNQNLDQQIQQVDRELMDLQAGFSQGLSFGTEDFTLEDLDPLNKK